MYLSRQRELATANAPLRSKRNASILCRKSKTGHNLKCKVCLHIYLQQMQTLEVDHPDSHPFEYR